MQAKDEDGSNNIGKLLTFVEGQIEKAKAKSIMLTESVCAKLTELLTQMSDSCKHPEMQFDLAKELTQVRHLTLC